MDKSYDPLKFESAIYKKWEKSDCFKPKTNRTDTYLVTMPPPNVTGVLHNGHALFVSLQDTFVRWQRMLGKCTLWLPGTDHAGIATQLMVEKQLAKEGTDRFTIGREKFLEKTWKWKDDHGGLIQKQLRAMGSSCDWSREHFTMDNRSSRAVKESFIRLFKEGLIYRAERMVNWSYGLKTAISDLEVEQKTTNGFMHHIAYPLADGSGELIVATTRPETMFGDVAVAVNPNDERYKKFHGKTIKLPLNAREIPIITDEYVDMEFGTGALKITPGHDPNDWEIGKKHDLETITVIDKDGTMNKLAGEFQGVLAAKARKLVSDKLEEIGLLRKKENYSYEQGFCQRSGVAVEPLVSMQWWVKVGELAKTALKAAQGKNPAIRFYPDHWKKTYFEWLMNIQDWCISRQLWWGHQIPIWHCKECGNMMVPKNADSEVPSVCDKCQSKNLEQDPDVLDTWYSSGLWPITTLGWPDHSEDLQKFYPMTRFDQSRDALEVRALMETGHDIIFFWVTRMVMMCTHFMEGRVPFEDVFLHAMVRDEKGQKMSKTKGNVIDPMDIINEHGADSLRLTLIALSGQGRSVNFDINRLTGYKGFLNKIWNATRFTQLNFESKEKDNHFFSLDFVKQNHKVFSLIDRWILYRLNETTKIVNNALVAYRPDTAFQAIYHFAWHEFCDWYLELSKVHLSEDHKAFNLNENSDNTLKTLNYCLHILLKLLHPMAPFLTEELYKSLPTVKPDQFIINETFPQYSESFELHENELEQIAELQTTVESLRNFVTENQIHPKKKFAGFIETENKTLWNQLFPYISVLGKLERADLKSKVLDGPSGIVKSGQFTISIPLSDLVDKEAEMKRLNAEITRINKDLEKVTKKLGNQNFVNRANPEIVAKEKEKAIELQEKIQTLRSKVADLKS